MKTYKVTIIVTVDEKAPVQNEMRELRDGILSGEFQRDLKAEDRGIKEVKAIFEEIDNGR